MIELFASKPAVPQTASFPILTNKWPSLPIISNNRINTHRPDLTMNRRLSQNASHPNHALTEDSEPNAKLHRRSIDNMQQSLLSGNDNGRHEVHKLDSSGPEVRISTPTQAKAPETIAQNMMDGDTALFHFGAVEQNNAVMQLALTNLLGGLHNQTPQQQQTATVVPNLSLYLQLLQLQRQPPQPQPQLQRGVVGTSMGGLNPVTQALWAAIASQQTSNMLSEYSSETDASGRWTTGGTTEGRSGSSIITDKSQGRLLVPCRARGMSVEHNFQTAYFEISPDIKHGDGLICSFPACRNRGVKFLYCAYCKDPVAKRNFRNQHSHSEGGGEKGVWPTVVAQQSNATMTPVKQHSQDEATPTVPSVFTTSKRRKMDAIEQGMDEGSRIVTASGNASSSEGDRSASEKSYENDEIAKKIANIDKARKSAWERLLVSRPSTDQNEELAAWLIRVMAVSDLKTPFRYEEDESS